MMQPIVVPLGDEERAYGTLVDWGPVLHPLSDPPAMVRGRGFQGLPKTYSVGVWECSPGQWRRAVMHAEFAHFVAGHGWFYPDNGEPFEMRDGVSVWFPPNTTGTWVITETLRKRFVIIDRTPLTVRALKAIGGRLGVPRLLAALRRRRRDRPWLAQSDQKPVSTTPVTRKLGLDVSER